MTRLAAGDWAPPAAIDPVEVDESQITDACKYNLKSDPHPMLALADQRPDLMGRWDRRGDLRDYAYFIGDYLERHNMGRIRRGR